MSHFKHAIESARYASHIHDQLEPDQVLRGNGRRYKPLGMAATRNTVEHIPGWKEKEREFQLIQQRKKLEL